MHSHLELAKKTSAITFRVDQEFENGLRKEAKEKRISMNTLANQIFGDHVELGQFMKKLGIVDLIKDVFLSAVNMTDSSLQRSQCFSLRLLKK